MNVEYERAMRRQGRRRIRHLVEQRRAEQATGSAREAPEPSRRTRTRKSA